MAESLSSTISGATRAQLYTNIQRPQGQVGDSGIIMNWTRGGINNDGKAPSSIKESPGIIRGPILLNRLYIHYCDPPTQRQGQ